MKKELVPETTREGRIHNIATTILGYFENNPDFLNKEIYVNTAKVREDIRSALGLPKLQGEAFFGDLRAHGDAMGGYGLHIKIHRRNGKRYIRLDAQTKKICENYLNNKNNPLFIE